MYSASAAVTCGFAGTSIALCARQVLLCLSCWVKHSAYLLFFKYRPTNPVGKEEVQIIWFSFSKKLTVLLFVTILMSSSAVCAV